MINDIEILKKIRNQIAHCMACYGDDPAQMMYKLEQLVLEWMQKSASMIIQIEPEFHEAK